MINLQLFVLNTDGDSFDEVELYDNESVTYKQSLQDIRDINKLFSDFSRTFSVPASKRNNKIFLHFHNYFIAGFDAKRRVSAKLFLNYELYKTGFIKLEGATTKDNKAFTYRLTFFGNGLVLKNIFKKEKLSSLALLTEKFSFDYTSANVVAFLQDGKDEELSIPKSIPPTTGSESIDIEDAIVFPLISHTKRMIYNSATGYAAQSAFANLANVTNGGLDVTELKPAIRVHSIIKAIEKSFTITGRKIRFSNDFFSQTNLPYYDLYLWLNNKTGNLFEDEPRLEFFQNFAWTGNKTADDGAGDTKTDIKHSVLALDGGNAIVPHPRQEELFNDILAQRQRKARITIETTTSQSFDFVIFKDGEEFLKETLTQNDGRAVIEETVLPDGVYSFAISTSVAVQFELIILAKRRRRFAGKKRAFEFSSTLTTGTDRKVIAALGMPDITILDFLTGLFKMFNLTAFQDADGTIKVQTLDNFFNSSTKVFDVTEFIDKDTVQIDSVIPYRKIEFKYEGTDTFLAKYHKDIAKKDWGALSTAGENDNYANKFGDDYTVVVPFEHMKFEKLIDINDDSDTGIQIGWSVDDSQSAFVGKPLLFYAVKSPITEEMKLINFDSSATTLAAGTSVYMPSNSREFGSAVTDSANLNYNAERNEFNAKVFKNTLFEQFYKNYITEIFDPQRRITKTKAFLPLRILLNIKLNDKILITDKLYKINNLTTNFGELSTQLELINTQNIVGEVVGGELNFDEKQIVIEGSCAQADSTSVKADNISITVDCAGVAASDGRVDVVHTNEGTDAENNEPDRTDGGTGDPVEVTAPTLNDPFVTIDSTKIRVDDTTNTADALVRSVTSSTYQIGYEVLTLGKIGTADNLDAYGFLISTTSSKLDGVDIDTIAGVSGVTKINYETETNGKRPTVPLFVSYKENSASSGVTYFFRFYARTNTSINFKTADVISETEQITTL